MCSNTSSSSGGGGGCNGGNGGVWSSSGLKIKQQKRPKVPKRGPGVAELEKIIREQNDEGFSSPCFSSYQNQTNPCNSLSLKPHPPPPPPPSPPSLTMTSRRVTVPASHSTSLPSHVPLAPKFEHLSPPTPPSMASLYGNGGYGTALGRSSGGSGLVLPEQPYLPMNLSSCRSSIDGLDASQSDSGNSSSRNLSSESNPIWAHHPMIPKRHNAQCPPPMTNQFLGSGTPAPPSPTSLPSGLQNNVEPPSNQSSYYNYTGRASEEQKIVGMKRPHPLSISLDNSLIPPSHFQYSPNLPLYSSRPHQSSPNDNHTSQSLTSNDSYRDATKWGSTLELNSKRFNYDNGGWSSHTSFPTFSAPSNPSPPMHMLQGELSKCNVLPYQVPENLQNRMEDSSQRLESSGSDHKPFYSFLEVNGELGKKDAALQSNHKDCEAGSDGIDLSLKL